MTMTTTTGNRRSRPQCILNTSSSPSPFGSAPTEFEVQKAINDLRRAMNGYGVARIEINKSEKIVHESHSVESSSIMKSSSGTKRLLDAYHLMESDASIKKMVMSISTDVKVWNSIVTNDAVQDLHSSLSNPAKEETAMSYTEEGESASQIVKWIFSFMKSGISDFITKIEGYVTGALACLPKDKNTKTALDGVLPEKIRASILLSIVAIMIHVVTKSIDPEYKIHPSH